LVFLLLAMLVIAPFLGQEKLTNVFSSSSMKDRFGMWSLGWKIFTEHPIIGNGINTFSSRFKALRDDEFRGKSGSYAHNGYLQQAADTGVIGFVIFLLIIIRLFQYSFAKLKFQKLDNLASRVPPSTDRRIFYRSFGLGVAAALAAFLIQSFFDTNLQSLPLVTFFWLGVGVLMASHYVYEE